MYFLSRTYNQILMYQFKIIFEVCNWILCRVLIINSKTSAQIQVFNLNIMVYEPFLQLLNHPAQHWKYAHISNLRAYMKMQTHHFNISQFIISGLSLPRTYTKFILFAPGGIILVSMPVNIRIYS